MRHARPPLRQLTLCADDFGLNRSISEGIAQLAQAGRLSAVSCITNHPGWLQAASLLEARQPGLSLGLHINLTEGLPLSRELAQVWPRLPSLSRLILAAHAGVLPRAALRAEMHAQLAFFRTGTGTMPHHLDGHQHVHHLPVVRDLLLDMVAGQDPAPVVRNTARLPGPGFALKRWLIRHTGAASLERELQTRKLPHNTRLLGVYDFQAQDYGSWMRKWLALLPATGGWLFCHPGSDGSPDELDAIRAARVREFAYLAGDDFLRDLDAAQVRLQWRDTDQAKVQRLLIPKVSSKANPVAST
jgi:predicted glycoside hydrolase/deacetylase ChbG (UPF0249 family)